MWKTTDNHKNTCVDYKTYPTYDLSCLSIGKTVFIKLGIVVFIVDLKIFIDFQVLMQVLPMDALKFVDDTTENITALRNI